MSSIKQHSTPPMEKTIPPAPPSTPLNTPGSPHPLRKIGAVQNCTNDQASVSGSPVVSSDLRLSRDRHSTPPPPSHHQRLMVNNDSAHRSISNATAPNGPILLVPPGRELQKSASETNIGGQDAGTRKKSQFQITAVATVQPSRFLGETEESADDEIDDSSSAGDTSSLGDAVDLAGGGVSLRGSLGSPPLKSSTAALAKQASDATDQSNKAVFFPSPEQQPVTTSSQAAPLRSRFTVSAAPGEVNTTKSVVQGLSESLPTSGSSFGVLPPGGSLLTVGLPASSLRVQREFRVVVVENVEYRRGRWSCLDTRNEQTGSSSASLLSAVASAQHAVLSSSDESAQNSLTSSDSQRATPKVFETLAAAAASATTNNANAASCSSPLAIIATATTADSFATDAVPSIVGPVQVAASQPINIVDHLNQQPTPLNVLSTLSGHERGGIEAPPPSPQCSPGGPSVPTPHVTPSSSMGVPPGFISQGRQQHIVVVAGDSSRTALSNSSQLMERVITEEVVSSTAVRPANMGSQTGASSTSSSRSITIAKESSTQAVNEVPVHVGAVPVLVSPSSESSSAAPSAALGTIGGQTTVVVSVSSPVVCAAAAMSTAPSPQNQSSSAPPPPAVQKAAIALEPLAVGIPAAALSPLVGGAAGLRNQYPAGVEQIVADWFKAPSNLRVSNLAVARPIGGGSASSEDALVPIPSSSGVCVVAIDNKIEQAMDLVKTHLMYAVREEVELLKDKIGDLERKVSRLEWENQLLREHATPEVLAQIQQAVGSSQSGSTSSASLTSSGIVPAIQASAATLSGSIQQLQQSSTSTNSANPGATCTTTGTSSNKASSQEP